MDSYLCTIGRIWDELLNWASLSGSTVSSVVNWSIGLSTSTRFSSVSVFAGVQSVSLCFLKHSKEQLKC